jgi:hypothetical protein
LSLIQIVRQLVLRRVLFTGVLAGVTLGGLLLCTFWLAAGARPARESGEGRQENKPTRQLGVELTRIVARELAYASGSPQIRAATAHLLPGWKELRLEHVEVRTQGLKGAPGFAADSPVTGFLRAEEGWVDLAGGNLLLGGGVLGQTSDGKEIRAERLEYEAARDEIRLVSADVRTMEFRSKSPYIITDKGLTRLETRAKYTGPIGSFFRKHEEGAQSE